MVVSHNLNDVFEVADRIVILHLGRTVAEGPVSEFDPSTVVDYMTTGRSSRGPGSHPADSPNADTPKADTPKPESLKDS
jgi:ABC-type sugar transport system ATPase subunit